MRHDAHGHWLGEVGIPDPRPAAVGELDAEIAVVGGGLTGLWTAWWVKQLEPDADVALLEAGTSGEGPSGRNGGFCNAMWFSLPTLRERFGDEAALEVCEAAAESVRAVGAWCEREGVDAHYRRSGYLQAAASQSQVRAWARVVEVCEELGRDDVFEVLDRDGVREICASPRFVAGIHYPDAATVHPARLVLGLRDRVIDAGVRLYERTWVRAMHERAGTVELDLRAGSLTASQVVIAAGSQMRLGGIRRQMTLTTSHMVVTEPVPDVIEALGWNGGECITDGRAMIHYFRTTRDGRIAFGWGGGPIAYGDSVRRSAEVNQRLARKVEADLLRFFPTLEGRRLTHAWGGPIDASPAHLPVIRTRGNRVRAAFGYTGNGVGPSQMLGRSLASLALGRDDESSRLPLVDPPISAVPPEPFRWVGGTAIRRALLRKERLEEEDRAVDPLTRAISGIPERIGFHVGR